MAFLGLGSKTKTASAAAGVAPPSAPPTQGVVANLPVAHVRHRSVQKLASLTEQLPHHSEVLTRPGGKLEKLLADSERHDVALLDVPGSSAADMECAVVCTVNFAEGAHGYADLRRRLEKAGWRCKPPYRATRELIQKLYEDGEASSVVSTDASEMERLFNAIAASAIEMGATDIHFELRAGSCAVKYRINKRLSRQKDLSGAVANTLLRTMYQSLSDHDTRDATQYSLKELQSCAIDRHIDGQHYRFRYQCNPVSPSGADCVLRILPIGREADERPFEGFESLGYSVAQSDLIREMFADPKGVILIAGKMGSGKSTTLKHGLEYLGALRPYFKIRTIEDPPEYYIRGASQHPVIRRVNTADKEGKGESDFARTFRTILRLDADATMLGEIRDAVTAGLTVQAGQAGQKVAATVHANSAFGIIGRLRRLAVDAEDMADEKFLSGLMFQELLPVVCPHCSLSALDLFQMASSGTVRLGLTRELVEQKTDTLKRVLSYLKPHARDIRFEGPGCKECSHRGTVGLTVCAEVVVLDDDMRQAIAAGDVLGARRHWESEPGLVSGADGVRCVDHGMSKLLAGHVSAEAFEESFGFITPRLMARTFSLLTTHPELFGLPPLQADTRE
ncbi:hypothetical protein E4T66_17980 [Sinimarinibacterium sp. CAU 1509]|uniref:GspE/PulE family protein n=1 Tax=Sinimarinibacterium sp. CAU 1509 TaxID=2562283 RepID=UPI0010AC564C|nr:ATPase, T2SS/T4P/T4SS family [Sinimarinibacterium sp. CAU 1509]TJY57295.1 hypothetical protein E4T66_17980 [Sinimarinibacterium sp. CAU 1509]